MNFDELRVGRFIYYPEEATGREYIYYIKRKGRDGVVFFGFVLEDDKPLSSLGEMFVQKEYFEGFGGSAWPKYTSCEDCPHKFMKHILENSLGY